MIENMNEIESSLGLAEGTLQAAIASDDATKIEIPAGKFYETDKYEIFTKEDYQKRTDNLKEENKQIGVEIAVKNARNELGLEFEGKTLENLLKASNDKILADAKIEPDTKIQELTTDLEKIKGISHGWETKYNDLLDESKAKDNQRAIDSNILDSISGDLTLSKPQIMTLFKAEYDIVQEDGKQLVKKGGVTLKNDTNLDPLTLSDIMPKFLEPFAKPVGGGNGGGDTGNQGKEGTLDAFVAEMESAGHDQMSDYFNEEMQKRIEANTLTI